MSGHARGASVRQWFARLSCSARVIARCAHAGQHVSGSTSLSTQSGSELQVVHTSKLGAGSGGGADAVDVGSVIATRPVEATGAGGTIVDASLGVGTGLVASWLAQAHATAPKKTTRTARARIDGHDIMRGVIEFLTDTAPPTAVPRVRTDRLLLREFRPADFDAFATNMADPIAMEHLSGVLDRRGAYRVFAGAMGYWMLEGAGWWAIELESARALVGTVGAFYRERPCDLELGWTIFRPYWRKGIASEAAAAALAFGFERLGADRAIAHIDEGNTASIGVSARLGMTFEGEVDFYGQRTGRYAIHRANGAVRS